jgi:hypothetical protein
MFDLGSYDAATRVKAKSLMAASLVGGGSGVVAGFNGTGEALTTGFAGVLFVLVAGHAGGFAGMMIKGLLKAVLDKKKQAEGRKSAAGDSADLILPALSFGALLGFAGWLVFADWGAAHLGAAAGAALGGLAGGLTGETMGALLQLILTVEAGGDMPRRGGDTGRLEIVEFKRPDQDEK